MLEYISSILQKHGITASLKETHVVVLARKDDLVTILKLKLKLIAPRKLTDGIYYTLANNKNIRIYFVPKQIFSEVYAKKSALSIDLWKAKNPVLILITGSDEEKIKFISSILKRYFSKLNPKIKTILTDVPVKKEESNNEEAEDEK